MPHPVDIHVGKRLRLRRNMLGVSQEELGKAVGITFQQVQKYERGANRVGSSRLYEFSEILNIPVGYFFEDYAENSSGSGFAEDGEDFSDNSEEVSREAMSLARSFYRIKNDTVRNRIVSLVKALSDGEYEE